MLHRTMQVYVSRTNAIFTSFVPWCVLGVLEWMVGRLIQAFPTNILTLASMVQFMRGKDISGENTPPLVFRFPFLSS